MVGDKFDAPAAWPGPDIIPASGAAVLRFEQEPLLRALRLTAALEQARLPVSGYGSTSAELGVWNGTVH
ncbi:MAG TPA: hypothetical protein VGS41_02700 [Chthonomonadales bacterium]|nr:hypothetical protein [Chthonomonadales bacterium]